MLGGTCVNWSSGCGTRIFVLLPTNDLHRRGCQCGDMSSLTVTASISDASYYGDRVTIFIPHLAPGASVFFDYRVGATGVQTSAIHPALFILNV